MSILEETYDGVKLVIETVLDRKVQSLLEDIALNVSESDVLLSYKTLKSIVIDYNLQIDKTNSNLTDKKGNVITSSIDKAKEELDILEINRQRFLKDVNDLFVQFADLLDRKKECENQKRAAKTDLDNYSTNLLEKYGLKLNEYLEKFGAEFSFVQRKTTFLGGKASNNYSIKINQVEIEIGDTKTNENFKSVLSEGDKSTLAFAFFMTRLEMMSDLELSKTIVVIDDPISSLDINRKTRTQEAIETLCGKVLQLIVLSHDIPSLRLIVDRTSELDCKQFIIDQHPIHGSEIKGYDVLKETQSEHSMHYATLSSYLTNSAADDAGRRKIASTIRLLLESDLKRRFPSDFTKKTMIGQFIYNITRPNPSNTLYTRIQNSILSEIVTLNDYSKKYHHVSNPDADKEPINDRELRDFVNRIFKFVHGV